MQNYSSYEEGARISWTDTMTDRCIAPCLHPLLAPRCSITFLYPPDPPVGQVKGCTHHNTLLRVPDSQGKQPRLDQRPLTPPSKSRREKMERWGVTVIGSVSAQRQDKHTHALTHTVSVVIHHLGVFLPLSVQDVSTETMGFSFIWTKNVQERKKMEG